MTPSLRSAKRVVVKIGSALIVDPESAAPKAEWLASVAQDIAGLAARGIEVIVVSSGAIALARRRLKLTGAKLRLEEKQAAAAVGQIRLAQAWSEALSAHGLTAAQLLITLEDTEDRRRYLNARATLRTLLDLACVPVINENDSVATAEIRFGDNDRLAARVAEMVQADILILLSDIDGLYTADPRKDPAARHIPIVAAMTPEIDAMGGEPPPGYSSGGMRTKLVAARIATQSGRSRKAPPAPGSCRRRKGGVPGRTGSPAIWPPWVRSPSMPGRRAPWRKAHRCCRPASRPFPEPSNAAMR
jgi:glutamate 5-kinase